MGKNFFTPEEEARIEAEVQAYKEKARQAEIEAEIQKSYIRFTTYTTWLYWVLKIK